MKKSTETTRSRAGFTLLEVLAAVAILGIWFSVLASIAIQGQRAEGENERRLRASLLADRVMLDLELGFDEGEFPVETAEEFEEDEFVVRIESLPISSLDFAEMDEGFQLLLEGDLIELAVDFHVVRLSVSWQEGHAEESISRITYAWDSTRLYEGLSAQDEFGEDGAPGGEAE